MTRADLDTFAQALATDYPEHWLKMSEPQRDYFRRMAERGARFIENRDQVQQERRAA